MPIGSMRVVLVTALTLLGAAGAWAQDYPQRNVTMIVPFAAGGPVDTIGRILAQYMSDDLGHGL